MHLKVFGYVMNRDSEANQVQLDQKLASLFIFEGLANSKVQNQLCSLKVGALDVDIEVDSHYL